jgi:HlyD family secretion protein
MGLGMNTEIFRKVSLERLSSPEHLDELLHVITPKDWLALLALFAVLVVILIWGVTGRIATKVNGEGVIVRSGTVLNVVSVGSGLVTDLYVNPGDVVRPNQLVARVAEPKELERLRLAKDAVEQALGNRQLTLRLHQQTARLRIDALTRTKSNAETQIAELRREASFVAEQVKVDEQLLAKGLITREHTLTTQQRLSALNGSIATLQAQIKQIDADIFAASSEPLESDVQSQNDVNEKQRTLAALQKELELTSNVVSPFAGQVVELRAVQGTLVEAGSPILTVQPTATQLQVILYLPPDKAKAVFPGMEAQVSPSLVKREEYGFIRGTVTYVAEFPASAAAMMRNFENQTLVDALLKAGPVTEVHLTLAPDPGTYSGFKWSSGKGPAIKLSSGTICTALVVTRQQPPVTLLLPYLKEKLGVT